MFPIYISANPACSSYIELNSADRHVSYATVSADCDSDLAVNWYRFTGAAGNAMPETCPAKYHCNTNVPGWLNGIHPTVAEGAVTRTVCYHWSSSCCNWSHSIKVLNCSGFYVYELQPTPGCDYRYCGTGAGTGECR